MMKELRKYDKVSDEYGKIVIKNPTLIHKLAKATLNPVRTYGWNWSFKSNRIVFEGVDSNKNKVAEILLKIINKGVR